MKYNTYSDTLREQQTIWVARRGRDASLIRAKPHPAHIWQIFLDDNCRQNLLCAVPLTFGQHWKWWENTLMNDLQWTRFIPGPRAKLVEPDEFIQNQCHFSLYLPGDFQGLIADVGPWEHLVPGHWKP